MSEKSHNIISALIAIAFVVVVQIFGAPQPVFRYLVPLFMLYLGGVVLYNTYYLRKLAAYTPWVVMRPVLLVLGWFGVYFFIPSDFWRGVFLLLGVPLICFVERGLGNPGEQLLFNETLLAGFTGYMSITALSHYFLLPGAFYLLLMFVFTVLLVRASFELVPQNLRTKWVAAFVLGILLTEIFWAISFLPLHYSAGALLAFNAFYAVWTICYYYLYNHLTVKKIQFQIALALIFTGIILIATPWRILN